MTLGTKLHAEKRSLIHRLNFWTKFICLLFLLPLCSFLLARSLLWVPIITFIILASLAQVSVSNFWRITRFYDIGVMIGITVLGLIFYETMFLERLLDGLLLSIRFLTLIWFGVLFAMVTNPVEIPTGLMKAGIPHRYGITVMVGLRMLPLLSRRVRNILDAQRARGAHVELSPKIVTRLIPLAFSLVIPTLHSTLETSLRLSDTLLSRGYDPYGRITSIPDKFRIVDYGLFIFSGFLLIMTISSRWLGIPP